MIEQHRVRNGLNEWNRVPYGYKETSPFDLVQAGDVQKINDEWYVEYPENGSLVGKPRGHGGKWYLKDASLDSNSCTASSLQ